MRLRHHIRRWALLSAACVPSRAAACESTSVRDATFLDARDAHRLCLISRQGDAGGDVRGEIEAWLREPAAGLNVQLFFEQIGDPQADWSRYGIPSAPPECPVAVLAGYHTAERLSFFVDHWAPFPARDQLELIAYSPARDEIRRRVTRELAVLLHFPATESGAPAVADALAAVTRRWSAPGSGPVSLLRVDRADPRERLLTSFTGVPQRGPDWVAVVFGRGKLMPPLVGDGITGAALDEQLRSLTEPCTCLRSPGAMGVDLPMVWRDADDASVVLIHGEGVPATDLASTVPGDPAGSGSRAGRGETAATRTRGSLAFPILATLAVLVLTQAVAALLLYWQRASGRTRS